MKGVVSAVAAVQNPAGLKLEEMEDGFIEHATKAETYSLKRGKIMPFYY